MNVIPASIPMVLVSSMIDEKIPPTIKIPSRVNMRNPAEAYPIFISLILISEASEIILIITDKPRKENLINISISFITTPSLL